MKKLLIVVGLIFAIVIAALIAIPLLFDPNDYKDTIISQVQKRTGRDLAIPGELKMSKFPSLGVDIGAIELGNADGFGDQPMLKSGQASVSVKLLPLLKKDVQVSTLTLRDVYINLGRNAEGKTNWDDLMALGGEKETKESGDAKNLAALAIGGIDLENANLVWDDKLLGKKYAVSELNLKTGELALNAPIDLALSAKLDAAAEGIAGDVALDGTIEYDLNAKKYSVEPIDFNADLTGSGVPGGAAKIKLEASAVTADLTAGTASISGLDLDALGTTVKGDIDASNIFDKIPLANGDITINADSIPDLLKALGQSPDLVPLKNLNAEAKFDSNGDRMVIEKLDANATLQGGQFPDPVDVKLNVKGDVDLGKQTANLTELKFEGLGTTVDGNIRASNITAPIPLLNGKLNINASDVAALLAALGQDASAIPLKSLTANTSLNSTADSMKVENLTAKATLAGDQIPNSPVDINLNTTADVNLKAETLNVESFTIKGMGLDVQGAVKGSQIIKNPNLNGTLKVAAFNLRKLMTQLNIDPPVTSDANVLGNLAFNSGFSATKNTVGLKGMTLTLDDSTIKGDLSVANFSNPAPSFNINIDKINVDRYLAPTAEGEKKAPATPETAAGAAAGLPLDTLRKLKANGTLNIGSLVISNAKLSNVSLGLDAKGGVIKLSPAKANLYKGSYNGDVKLDATGKVAVVNLNSALAGVQAAPLITDLTGKSKIDGTMSAKINITTSGATPDAMKKTLNGNSDFKFENGALLGVNLAKIIREAKAKLSGQTAAATTEEVKTDFSELGATATIKNGVVSNQDFLMKSPFIRVNGAGTANLVNEAVDYNVTAKIVGTYEGQGGADLNELKGLAIPIKVSGTFTNLSYKPDVGGLLKARADQELEKQKEKLQGKAAEKLEKVLPGDLKGLLGGGSKSDAAGDAAPVEGAANAAPKEEAKPEDMVKDKLKDMLKF